MMNYRSHTLQKHWVFDFRTQNYHTLETQNYHALETQNYHTVLELA